MRRKCALLQRQPVHVTKGLTECTTPGQTAYAQPAVPPTARRVCTVESADDCLTYDQCNGVDTPENHGPEVAVDMAYGGRARAVIIATQVMAKSTTNHSLSRRRMVRSLGAAGAALLAPSAMPAADSGLRVAGKDVAIQLTSLGPHSFRLTVRPIRDGRPVDIADDGTLLPPTFGAPAPSWGPPGHDGRVQKIKMGRVRVAYTSHPLAFAIQTANGEAVQRLRIDKDTAVISFTTGPAPILGLGEGGPQFDRRGNTDRMMSGSSGYNLRNFGSRVPIPWLIGTGGWALYIHRPYGRFDFTGAVSAFQPAPAFVPGGGRGAPPPPPADISTFALPIDIFFVASKDPAVIMAEWARLTGPRSCRRSGASAISSRTARCWDVTRFFRKPKPSARRNCPATP